MAKEFTLGALTITAGLANAYLWQQVFRAGDFPRIALYSLPVAAFFAFAILFALSAAFIRSRRLRDGAAIASVTAGFFFVPASGPVLSMAALAALATWYAAETIASDRKRSLRFQVRSAFRGGLPVFFSAAALLLAAFYLATFSGAPEAALVPRALFDAALPIAGKWSPDLSLVSEYAVRDRTLGDVAAASLAGIGTDVNGLAPFVREEYLRGALDRLSKNLGIPASESFSGEEKAGDVLYQSVNAEIDRLLGPYRRYIPYLGALGFFVAVKTSTYPIYWAALLLIYAVVKLLLAIGIIQRKSETVQAERLTL